MSYFARFEEISGQIFRFDTRIYLTDFNIDAESICVGAIVGKNPGSAKPRVLNQLQSIELDGDKMLPTVRNRFLSAYQAAKKKLPENAFVRVWNLFYLCNPDLNSAVTKIEQFPDLPVCKTELENPPIVWFGWGGSDDRLNKFKERFLSKNWENEFYYNHIDSKVISSKPMIDSFAKHTQGMPAKPINEHLASIIENYS